MATVRLFDNQSATGISPELNVGRATRIVAQVGSTQGTFTMRVQGRLSEDADCDWFNIASITNANLVGGTYALVVTTVCPYMRYRVTAAAGSPGLDAWINF